ncbi:MAG: cytochrome c3 family protein, partial [Gemmatimonadota bacterium]
VECHPTPVSLPPSATVAECRSCHEDHHGNGRTCSSCHSLEGTQSRHTDPQAIHQRCDACHTRSTVALLNPTRPFCVTCHGPQREDHYEPRQCTVCHFMAEPATFRSRLLGTPGSH